MKKIRIVSPAKAIDKECLQYADEFLTLHGFDVDFGEYAAGQFNYFSGTDDQRLEDMQRALDDHDIDIILCSRGGYGCVRLIDQLDFSEFSRHPKPIIGYSDVTVFHNHLHTNLEMQSVHATAPLNFKQNTKEALDSLLNVLNDTPNRYELPAQDLNTTGNVSAVVVGGNLSIICSLIGTNSDIDTTGKILFIEEVGEAVYSIDRMMWSLKKSGKLAGLEGLIVGGLTNVKDSEIPFGQTAEEVIAAAVAEFDFAVCFNFPAGHIADNRAIIFGKEAKLNVFEDIVSFEQ